MVSDMSEIRQIAEGLIEQGYCQKSEMLKKVQDRFNKAFDGDDSLSILLRQSFELIIREVAEEK